LAKCGNFVPQRNGCNFFVCRDTKKILTYLDSVWKWLSKSYFGYAMALLVDKLWSFKGGAILISF
jgi:hypothetical protein